MTKLRQLWLLTALGSVAVLALGYFLAVAPKASKAAAVREDTETQLAANRKLRGQIDQLNKQKKDLPKQQAILEKFATRIPNNPGLPALIRSLSDAADNAGVELVSLSPGTPALVPSSVPQVVTAKATSDDASKDATPKRTVVPSAMLPTAAIPLAIQVTGNYSQVSQFLSEIESLPRALLVGGFSIVPGDNGPTAKKADAASAVIDDTLTISLTGQVFMTTTVAAPTTAAKPAATTAAK